MLKLMKYEIKGTYKYILAILALVLLLFTAIQLYVKYNGPMMGLGGVTLISISTLIIFGSMLATFLYIVGSFKKELYEDRGYLTFSLPLSGRKFVGAKLLVATAWFLLLGLVTGIYNLLFALQIVDGDFLSVFKDMLTNFPVRAALLRGIGMIMSIISLILIIYFSMALSRVTFQNKRIGGLWFVIFLVLSIFLAYGQFKIAGLFPYYLDLQSFTVAKLDSFLNLHVNIEINNGVSVSASSGTDMVNIASMFYNVIVLASLFIGTSYFVERKIDL
ncbi:hypothetical protein [Bacillus kwashiorkori]|uniref:hypothetical protein n=1 Tax=Bacillus kwashiorkori TaxID=1522318 RepID=UPI0007840AB0|nr:hypothetical protein [Bacillus kwashiorkori]